MRKFQKVIKHNQNLQNFIFILRALMQLLILSGIIFTIFYFFFNFTTGHQSELFIFSISLKVLLAIVFIYFVIRTVKLLMNQYRSARYLDKFNQDTSDTYQNAYELYLQQRHFSRKFWLRSL